MENYLEDYIEELLHINEGSKNKLIDLEAGDLSKTYYLSHKMRFDIAEYALEVIRARIGKVGNTVLRGSAVTGEQVIGRNINDFEWRSADGLKDPRQLDMFITGVYKELNLKGNNPLFLSIGEVRWKISVTKDVTKVVRSPLLIFPIRLIRSVSTSPVYIEFVDDDAYFNPCLIHKFRQVLGEEVADAFPHPNGGGDFDDPISLEKLGSGKEYFAAAGAYVAACKRADIEGNTVFEFEKDVVAIAQYNHGELCMYYDIKRNRDKIYAHPLVKKVFTESLPERKAQFLTEPEFVLPRDSVQEEMIRRVVNGESLIIKGPPGTGKTLTIANMIAALLAQNKKILLSSKKLSALSEVNAKLPEPLRKFVMLMDYETEAQAAQVNPVNVKADFRALLKARREYASDSAANKLRDQGNNEKTSAIVYLSDYVDKLFSDGTIAGGSYYEALDTYLKNDVTEVAFAAPEEVLPLSRKQYEVLLSAVKDAGNHYHTMTGGGAHPVKKCPWFSATAGFDEEKAFSVYTELAALADKAYGDIRALLSDCGEGIGALKARSVADAMRSVLTEEETLAILSVKGAAQEFSALSKALSDYLIEKDGVDARVSVKDGALAAKRLTMLADCDADLTLTLSEAKNLYAHAGLFRTDDGAFLNEAELASLVSLTDRIAELYGLMRGHLSAARRVFSEEVCEKERATLMKAAQTLEKYAAAGEKPKALDFKAKKTYEKLCGMSFLGNVSFRNVAEAVAEFSAAAAIGREIDALTDRIYMVFRRKLTDEELRCIFIALEKSGKRGESVRDYLTALGRSYDALFALAECAEFKEDCPLAALIGACRAGAAEYALKDALAALGRKVSLPETFGQENAEKTALSALAVGQLFSAAPFCFYTPQENCRVAHTLRNVPEDKKERLFALFAGLKKFGETYFRSYYTDPAVPTVDDLKIFALEADDRNVLSAALRYFALLHAPENALPLHAFFLPFEKGEKERKGSFEEIFEHSFFRLAVTARMQNMRLLRNGLGKNAARSLEKLAAAEKKISDANVSVTEGRCMARIDPEDTDFAFLAAERDPAETLRSLFKKYPKAILKLKKCFILSPSTASVLFRPEEYEDFDIVIVDEASQLEPVNLLPVLFRAKQCVIVGDEWQMPPIKHFVASYEKRVVAEDGTVRLLLEPELSALTLALRNQAFRAEELVCHYRSKTESLIAFSQKQFYPYMRTFPAAVPMREGLGFTDVYVPDGRCVGGVNREEAEKVAECIRAHFARYYDEEKQTLKESFGVVAFGQEQTEYIERLVHSDKELHRKISLALQNFDDVPEKLIFFKTIETVQGQETAHLILSLTYGRTADGRITASFGQLNRDKLGKCIFNVAVTRAQYSVTIVHSVEPCDITGENVSYIREYLEIARRFAEGGRGQFVSEEPERGFLKSVGDFIVSCGIDAKRVVYNYGVTEGSVRMPIAVLSSDMQRAELGVWCEKPTGNKYNYLDYNMRYYMNFAACGWNLCRIYAHDWVDNAEAEREALAAALKKYVK